MQRVDTLVSSNFETIGKRICDVCNSEVPIIRVKSPFREEEISHCLKCEENKLQKEIEEFEKKRNISLFQKQSFIPDDILNARFSTYRPADPSQHEAKRIAMEYAKNFNDVISKKTDFNSLLFRGDYGLGKSHLAQSIARELLKKRYDVIFIDVPQLLQSFRNSITSHELNEQKIMKAITDTQLLIMDDLGAEYIKKDNGKESWAVDKLFQIFSLRNNKPKIITTNYDPEGLEEKYGTHGGRIISRMMMGTKPIKIEGKDYRIKSL